jgi:hypothetical protein
LFVLRGTQRIWIDEEEKKDDTPVVSVLIDASKPVRLNLTVGGNVRVMEATARRRDGRVKELD